MSWFIKSIAEDTTALCPGLDLQCDKKAATISRPTQRIHKRWAPSKMCDEQSNLVTWG